MGALRWSYGNRGTAVGVPCSLEQVQGTDFGALKFQARFGAPHRRLKYGSGSSKRHISGVSEVLRKVWGTECGVLGMSFGSLGTGLGVPGWSSGSLGTRLGAPGWSSESWAPDEVP